MSGRVFKGVASEGAGVPVGAKLLVVPVQEITIIGNQKEIFQMRFKNGLYIIFFALVFTFSINAQKVGDVPTISVTGTAEVKVVPDSAVFRMSVEKISKSMVEAKRENDASVSQVFALTKKYGITKKDVKTDFISVSKRYEWIGVRQNRRRIFKGYAVSKTIIVKLKDLKNFEAFFTDVLTTGVSAVKSVKFQSSEFQKHRKEMRIKAMRVAKAKAFEIARAIDQSIGKALRITENSGSRFTNANITTNYFRSARNTTPTVGTFSPGTITIRSQVSVKFLLN